MRTEGGAGPHSGSAESQGAHGAASLGGRGRNGWDGLGTQEGRRVWPGRGNTARPSFSTRREKNPGSVWLLNALMQQDKHAPVAVKGPSLQSHKPAGHT